MVEHLVFLSSMFFKASALNSGTGIQENWIYFISMTWAMVTPIQKK